MRTSYDAEANLTGVDEGNITTLCLRKPWYSTRILPKPHRTSLLRDYRYARQQTIVTPKSIAVDTNAPLVRMLVMLKTLVSMPRIRCINECIETL